MRKNPPQVSRSEAWSIAIMIALETQTTKDIATSIPHAERLVKDYFASFKKKPKRLKRRRVAERDWFESGSQVDPGDELRISRVNPMTGKVWLKKKQRLIAPPDYPSIAEVEARVKKTLAPIEAALRRVTKARRPKK